MFLRLQGMLWRKDFTGNVVTSTSKKERTRSRAKSLAQTSDGHHGAHNSLEASHCLSV